MWVYLNIEIIISNVEETLNLKEGQKRKIENLYKEKAQNKIAEINLNYQQ